ncbi:hypothetical protein SARC_02900 [Sphaeroforma arctica JP610]|uniref:Uncharacterized protein n=1 Tax=Sphaeroforma arctica JP610 TaxID=667725 RepID=A0A0L0G774_9EUKA|nr:hypothetical protein SARC_02900 [Sphaeroforma arctica JP610]KNC84892.1 hypothetical protein SARC_02900 [Sphaeroforma arctica JP610]|eukprot:XP_014158794.1 hypothetical protein SARC_02900 [Sphaeroforma arctica JP610]
MVKVSATSDIPMDAATYWLARNTREFVSIENVILQNASKEIKDFCNAEGAVERQLIVCKPDLSLVPPFLMKMGPEEGIVLTDHITIVKDGLDTPYQFKCTTVPNIFPDKCKINSVLKVFPSKDGSKMCKQTIDIDIKVGVWGVGSSVESLVSGLIVEGYKKLPRVTREYLKNTDISKIPSPVKAAEVLSSYKDVAGMEITMDDEEEYFYDAEDSFVNTLDSYSYSDSGIGSPNTSDDTSLDRMGLVTQQPESFDDGVFFNDMSMSKLLGNSKVQFLTKIGSTHSLDSAAGFLTSPVNGVEKTYVLDGEGGEPRGWTLSFCGLNLCCR